MTSTTQKYDKKPHTGNSLIGSIANFFHPFTSYQNGEIVSSHSPFFIQVK